MARITVEDCLELVPNRFALVQLAAKRAKQLLAGAPAVTDTRGNKAIVSSLREVADGKVRFMTDEEMSKAAEERAAQEAQAMAIESTTPRAPVQLAWAEKPVVDDDDEDEKIPAEAPAANGAEAKAPAAEEDDDDDDGEDDSEEE